VAEQLKGIADLERIVTRCACGSANGRDLLALKNSLQRISPIRQLIEKAASVIVAPVVPGVVPMLGGAAHSQPPEPTDNHNSNTNFPDTHDMASMAEIKTRENLRAPGNDNQPPNTENLLIALSARMNPLDALAARLDAGLVDQPPLSIRDGGIFCEGYNADLDELRSLTGDSKTWIAALRQREAERTGISNLKVGFNRVFGYYLEVSHGQSSKVPPEWIRKQTLTSGERYVTPELKEKEEIILNADERANELEFQLFEELRAAVCEETAAIQMTARAIAQLDAIYALANTACARNYVRPVLAADSDEREIIIRDGRHPVLETLRGDVPFVPNDTRLTNSDEQILIITGPNMAGKSTYIRQVALITLMAHIGSFVPATEARIAPVDRIFTRVGAMDQIAKGQSTFLVEMSETANILNNATDRSLVILDEIGRGTSTYDGLSIAWSVVEYLHNTPGRRPKTLFVTHYHELAGLEGPLPRVRNYNVAVHEEEERVAFLYRILRGHTDHSYGIYAAQVAGLPRNAVSRARRILADLEKGNVIHVQTAAAEGDGDINGSGNGKASRKADTPVRVEERTVQLTFFDLADHPVLEKLRTLEINTLTPLQALSLLAELKQDAKK
jgi:DNA mismatch repair protein MutS